MTPKLRVAIVTPWYGRELLGGAERLAWELAHALVRAGAEVDVLATCCKSFLDDWAANYHKSGESRDGSGVVLHRFPVDSRDRVAFNRANTVLTTMPRIGLRGDRNVLDDVQTRAFVNDNINSSDLLQYLRDRGASYDAVIFVPYLYGPTLAGVPLVADRAFVIPCVHDEAYAYIRPVRDVFAVARGVLFNSVGEEETAAAIYGPGLLVKSHVIGHAVEPVAPPAAPLTIGAFAPHRARYVLYLGRQDSSKNIAFLVEAFRTFRKRRVASSLQLVLAGPRAAAHSGDGILDLGAVTEPAKASLLTYARALAQPSMHESFSRAMYEAWYARRPVLVHGECRATSRAVEDAGGGWIGSTVEEWVAMLAAVDESSDDAVDAIGAQGWAAALEHGDWNRVAQRTIDAICRQSRRGSRLIDQIVPLGDAAISGYAHVLTEAFQASGYDAAVTIAGTPGRPGAVTISHLGEPSSSAGVIVAHHADAAAIGGQPLFAASQALATRLMADGVAARVLPRVVSPGGWNGLVPAHEQWVDGKTVVLSIAPVTAGDARRLMDMFLAFLGRSSDARLLIFRSDCDHDAYATLLHERTELDLEDAIAFVSDEPAERYAAYRAATVAVAFGSAVDIDRAVTALWFDLPVIALADAAVRETIAGCGIVADDFDPRRLAALVRIVVNDAALRAVMVAEGRRVRARHAPATIVNQVLEALGEGEQAAVPTFLPLPVLQTKDQR